MNLTPIQLINSGALDGELDNLDAAIKQRRQAAIHTLHVGQEIWLNNTGNPRYLNGRRCIVQEVKRTRILVKLVHTNPGERFQGNFNCPMSLITVKKPEYAVD